MLERKKLLIGIGAALVIVGSLAAGTAVAQTPTPEAKTGANTMYQNFLGKLAGNLGISVDNLTKAIDTTRDQILDEAVQNGKITKDQADKIKQRTPNGNLMPFIGKGHFGFKGKRPGTNFGVLGRDVTVQALANLTGKTVDQVKQELQSDKNIKKFLDDNKITNAQLHDAVVQIVQQKVDQAVKDGKLTQQQADNILNKIKQAPCNGFRPNGFAPRSGWRVPKAQAPVQ
ncbi:MAG: hypothetical protein M1358_12505 [Chloroflexi bacterium]|nr:hypothetical protein [Chloroflexota bacterium]